jgi:chromosomal replication initiator protein
MPPLLETSGSLHLAWANVLARVEKDLGAPEVDAWLRGSRLVACEDGVATVDVPTPLHQNRMSAYLPYVREVLAVRECQIRVMDLDLEAALFSPEYSLPSVGQPAPVPAAAAVAAPALRPPDALVLHPDYNFDSFVVGPCNRFAHAAAVAVSEKPANAFNPLFLHGSVGLGKTHLMQAIAHGLRERNPQIRITYLSCEQFTNHFILALRQGSFDSFRDHYRHTDVLIVDDVHLLANKQRTQEEFFHTFNALHGAGKQIVLSSDSPPQDIPSLQERLVSRFKWGLVAEIEKPCFETRVAILLRKAEKLGIELPDTVARFMAEHVQNNVRELEGGLLNLKALAALDGQAISLRLAQRAMQPSTAAGRRAVRMDDVLEAVVGHLGAKLADLQSKRRSHSVVGPRQIAMYLARKLTPMSLEEIGGYFGGRDHSTVIYAVQKVADRMRVDGEYARRVSEVERLARAGTPRRS